MNKIIPFDRFLPLRKSINKKIVLVGGCFDVFHYGHLVFLKKARQQGDLLVVLLEPDEAILAKKKQSPIHNQFQRAKILEAIEYVDYIISIDSPLSDQDYFAMIAKIKPAIIAITEGDVQSENKRRQAKMIGGKMVVVTPLIKKFSSTNIKNHASISGH